MKIFSITNNYNNQGKDINFRNRDYFLNIKQLPDMTCGCCGKKTLSVDKFIKTITPLCKPLSYVLSRGKLDYTQKYFPNAWKTLWFFAKKYPELTLDEIVESQENYVQLKVNVAQELENPNIEEKTRERHYLDRRIGGRFFDLLARARCITKNASIVMRELEPLEVYLDGLKKEAFEILKEYSKIYPEKTLTEIINEVHEFHDKRSIEYKQNKINQISECFNNIKKIAKSKNIKASEIFDSLSEKSWEILKTEPDPECRKYKIKQLYFETLKKNNYEDIIPEVSEIIDKIPTSVINVDTFFSYAYWKHYSDEGIISTIFNPIIASEEHIVTVSNNGADTIGNKTVLCKECNDLRKSKYREFIEYHPEMHQNTQAQMNIITDNILSGKLTDDYRFYPFTIAQTFRTESDGKIDLDLTFYSKEILRKSKQQLKILEKEIEDLCEERNTKIYEIQKNQETESSNANEINEINARMQAIRDQIWTEKNLQTIIGQYLKGKNK